MNFDDWMSLIVLVGAIVVSYLILVAISGGTIHL